MKLASGNVERLSSPAVNEIIDLILSSLIQFHITRHPNPRSCKVVADRYARMESKLKCPTLLFLKSQSQLADLFFV